MEDIKFITPKKPVPSQGPKGTIKKTETADPFLNLVREISQLISTNKLYGTKHKLFQEHLKQVFPKVSKFISEKQSVTFFEAENNLLVNRNKIDISDGLTKRFLKGLHELDIGYLILEAGLTLEEFTVFIHLLCNEELIKGDEKIKKYLQEKGVKHILVRSATYKLIEEDEKVVKRDDVLAVEELSFEIRNRFIEDLKQGDVIKKLKQEEEKYKNLAHNPILLSKTVFDLVKDKNSPEELAKVLWLIGDYLIGEIDSAKVEKINRKAIEELKKQIFLLWGEQIKKEEIEKHIEKTFAAITLASQLKSLTSLYERHQKNLEKTASKIQDILGVLPPQSQLYQQTKERLEKIGFSLKEPQK